ncbi:unnamed protein product, partial [Ectocarpus sp. 12 AP-2014]
GVCSKKYNCRSPYAKQRARTLQENVHPKATQARRCCSGLCKTRWGATLTLCKALQYTGVDQLESQTMSFLCFLRYAKLVASFLLRSPYPFSTRSLSLVSFAPTELESASYSV